MSEQSGSVKQAEVRRWWDENPMLYDWHGTIPFPVDSPEYLDEVERRFLSESWFAQAEGAAPYSGLLPFESLRDKDVLEIGCGSGVHTKALAAAGARVTGIDLTPRAVELTGRRLAAHGLAATVVEGDAERLPFPDASFDWVWSWGVIHHSSNTERVLEEIARVLRPGGGVGLMVYHRTSITYWVNYILIRGVLQGRLLRESPAEVANRYSDGAVARHFTPRELTAIMSPHFEQVQTQIFGQVAEAIPLPAALRRPIARLVPLRLRQSLLRRFGWFLFASARRR
jgi:SAM-dependent methyltransferase